MSTQDQYEARWRSKLADSDWLAHDGEGRVAYAVSVLHQYGLATAARILDVGCGRGALGRILGRQQGLFGVDISQSAVTEAAKVYESVAVVNVDEEPLPYKASFFDVCVLLDVIEHIFDPRYVLGEIHRVLKPGGHLLVFTPNILQWSRILYMLRSRRFPKTSEDDDLYDGGHIHFFTYRDVADLLSEVGFVSVRPVGPHSGQFLYEFRDSIRLLARKRTE